MKISVGQVLIVVGVGTYVFLGPLEGWEKSLLLVGDARSFAADKLPYMEFLRKSGEKAKPASQTTAQEKPAPQTQAAAAPITVEDKLPAGEAPATSKNFSEVPLTPVPPTQAAADVPTPLPVDSAVEAPKTELAARPLSHRRRRSAARAAASAAAPAKKSAAKKSADSLVGTYVSLTLKTGNAVKGMLVERTATNYKIELPGMGAFDYPANTVKAIAAAE